VVGRPGGGDGGWVVRGLGGGVESAGQVGVRELRLLAGVGEEIRDDKGGGKEATATELWRDPTAPRWKQ